MRPNPNPPLDLARYEPSVRTLTLAGLNQLQIAIRLGVSQTGVCHLQQRLGVKPGRPGARARRTA
jgi:hypothetical protein